MRSPISSSNPDFARASLAKYTTLPPKVVAGLKWPNFSTHLSPETSLKFWNELAVRQKLISAPIDLKASSSPTGRSKPLAQPISNRRPLDVARRFVDLSVALKAGIASDPATASAQDRIYGPRLRGAKEFEQMAGVPVDKQLEGKGCASERCEITTHVWHAS